MAEKTPLYMDINNVYSGDEMGLPNRDFISEGVVGANDYLVSAGAGNTVNIAAGACWILGDTDTVNQPVYRVINDAVVNKGITPDPTNPRIVLIIGQITDATFSGATRAMVLTALHGTPAGSPVAPALPASAILLSTITVPAAAASSAAYTIVDSRVRAKVGGGQAQAASASTTYRKVTPKAVNTTVAATDLLNGEITIAAGVMGLSGLLRMTLIGDWLQTSGGAAAPPRFQVVLGGVTIFDTGTTGTISSSALRYGWRLQAEILNLGAANAQASTMRMDLTTPNGTATQVSNPFTTGAGYYIGIPSNAFTNSGNLLAEGVNTATAIDTSTAKLLNVNVINASASASYETKLYGAVVEIL